VAVYHTPVPPPDSTTVIGSTFFGEEASQTNPKTFASMTFGGVAVTRATQIRVAFNPDEGGNGGNGIQLDDMVLKIYCGAGVAGCTEGALLWNSNPKSASNPTGSTSGAAFIPKAFSGTDLGGTHSGFVYRIDFDAARELDALGYVQPNNRLAMEARVSGAGANNDNFIPYSNRELGLAEIPEPATWTGLLASAGIFALQARRRRSERG
jgi:hypothetical protein